MLAKLGVLWPGPVSPLNARAIEMDSHLCFAIEQALLAIPSLKQIQARLLLPRCCARCFSCPCSLPFLHGLHACAAVVAHAVVSCPDQQRPQHPHPGNDVGDER